MGTFNKVTNVCSYMYVLKAPTPPPHPLPGLLIKYKLLKSAYYTQDFPVEIKHTSTFLISWWMCTGNLHIDRVYHCLFVCIKQPYTFSPSIQKELTLLTWWWMCFWALWQRPPQHTHDICCLGGLYIPPPLIPPRWLTVPPLSPYKQSQCISTGMTDHLSDNLQIQE